MQGSSLIGYVHILCWIFSLLGRCWTGLKAYLTSPHHYRSQKLSFTGCRALDQVQLVLTYIVYVACYYSIHHSDACVTSSDASAKTQSTSLNNCLYTGPSFSQSIFDILLRLCFHWFALAGNIEKAFLMVSVQENDRNSLMWLSWDSPVLCLELTPVLSCVMRQ